MYSVNKDKDRETQWWSLKKGLSYKTTLQASAISWSTDQSIIPTWKEYDYKRTRGMADRPGKEKPIITQQRWRDPLMRWANVSTGGTNSNALHKSSCGFLTQDRGRASPSGDPNHTAIYDLQDETRADLLVGLSKWRIRAKCNLETLTKLEASFHPIWLGLSYFKNTGFKKKILAMIKIYPKKA